MLDVREVCEGTEEVTDNLILEPGWLLVKHDTAEETRTRLTFRESQPCSTGVVIRGDLDLVGKAIVWEPGRQWHYEPSGKPHRVVHRGQVIAVLDATPVADPAQTNVPKAKRAYTKTPIKQDTAIPVEPVGACDNGV
jgi:hypothetical protein